MTPIAFLNTVLPDTGRYCVVGIRDKHIKQFFVPNIEDIVDAVGNANPGWNMFYACSTYFEEDDEHRTADNVMLTKSFWVDLDIGDHPKKYKSQVLALEALREFYKELGLPRPLIVNSGGGIHAYWVTDEPMEYSLWKPIAEKLKAVCVAKKLKIDATCTADAARILRVPGSLNYKEESPRPCEVMFDGKHKTISPVDFAGLLGEVPTVTPGTVAMTGAPAALGAAFSGWVASDGLDETTKNIAGSFKPSSFMKIVRSGECAQITYIVENQAEVSEPLWRAGLSIANACLDREEAIHFMSKDHPQYNAGDTIKKAELTAGPYHCARFADEDMDVCKGCPHFGKITSPISLGKVIELAQTKTEEVKGIDEHNKDERTYTFPEYPWPFVRGKNGEVVLQDKSKEEGFQEEIIYENPFYAVKRMHDPELGEMVWVRLHLPMDGVREFSLPLRDISAKDRFRDAIAMKGVVASGKKLDSLMLYMQLWTRGLQKMAKTELIRGQFGWTENDTFILGDREICKGNIVYSPPSTATLNVCNMLTKSGTKEGWKKMADFYNAPGLEPQCFALFLGFGAPLLRFTQIRGGVVNLQCNASGVGKTTVLHMINSIWGQSEDLLLQEADTFNSRIHRMGVLQHLPVTMDEITNMSGGQVSDLVYSAFSGRGKNRMNSQSNSERNNTTTWQTPIISTSNSSLEDKLRGDKAFPEGELMRLMEMEITRDTRYDKIYTDRLFANLAKEYGVVGEIYMQYIVNNIDRVKEALATMQKQIDSDATLTQRERIWSSFAAVALTGGQIAGELGLHSIDEKRVARWLQGFLLNAKENVTEGGAASGVSALGTYLDTHWDETLMINDAPLNGMPVAPLLEPRNQLSIRIEPDTRTIYLASTAFRKWCSDNQVGVQALVKELETQGVRTEFCKKRMGKGTAKVSVGTNAMKIHDPTCVLFNFDNPDEKRQHLTSVPPLVKPGLRAGNGGS